MVVPSRHSLVWLSAAGWRAIAGQVTEQHRSAVSEWYQSGWPLTVRRHDIDCPSDQLCLGIALPPLDGVKARLPFRVALDAIDSVQTPLSIPEVLTALPDQWRDAASRLHGAAQMMEVDLKVYGSAALQAITGLTYLHPTSDLDLVLQPKSAQQLDNCVCLFKIFSSELPLDGEIIFGDGFAVAAKEWCNAAYKEDGFRVLVKHATGVALMRKDALLALLECSSCMPM